MSGCGSPIDSSSAICSDASRDASRARPVDPELDRRPGIPTANETLSPASAAQLPQLGERPSFTRLAGAATQHGAGGDAHRQVVGVIVRQRVGDPACPLPTDPGSSEIAVGRPRGGAHVPAVRGMQFTCGLQMFGDQRRVLVGRPGRTLLDHGGQAAMQLGAIGFQLRFVGDRADQRVVEGVLGAPG